MRLSNFTNDELRKMAADHHRLAAWPVTMTRRFVATQLAAAAAIEELLDRRTAMGYTDPAEEANDASI